MAEEIQNEDVNEEESQEETSLINEEADLEKDGKDGDKNEEGKADGDKKADDDSKKDDKKDVKAPDEYKDFTVPEGYEALDPEALAEFGEVAKEADLSQEDAQKFVDMYARKMRAAQEAQANAWADTLKSWREESTKDEEIGGPKFQESVGNAKKALDVFGNEKLKSILDQTGMGNNVELIRMLSKIGAAVSNDKMVFGKSSGDAPKSPENILYPDMK